jgi:hypothetical protein
MGSMIVVAGAVLSPGACGAAMVLHFRAAA